MEWLNYHHLHYFWVVAREGGLTQASKVLRLARPTLSGQVHALEERLGEKLFVRSGRRLVLTDTGRLVQGYADGIFSLGSELLAAVQGRATAPPRLDVGIADVVTKLVVRRLLDPVLRLPAPVHLVCHEDTQERLLARLGLNELDVILTDAPVPAASSTRAFNHLLGECGCSFFAAKGLANLRQGFPRSLDGAPLLLPLPGAPLRRSLDQFFLREAVRPRVIAEFEDSALLKIFGADGIGVFAAPTIVEREVRRQYGVTVIGRSDAVRERFYAISSERRIHDPAVLAITTVAQQKLFGPRRAG